MARIKQLVQSLKSFQLHLSVYILGVVAARVPISRGPFFGDDFDAINARINGRYASNPITALSESYGEKWRPLNTFVMTFLLKFLNDSYLLCYLLSIFLLLLLTITCVIFLRNYLQKMSHLEKLVCELILVALIATSPLTWMAKSGVFGFLELAPAIFIIFSFQQFSKMKQVNSNLPLIYSVLLIMIAVLIHERHNAIAIGFAAISYFQAKDNPRFKGVWLAYLLVPIFFVYSTAVVLKIDPLVGGGEERIINSYGTWMIFRPFVAMGLLLFGSGRIWVSNSSNNQDMFDYVRVFLTLAPFLTVLATFVRQLNKSQLLKPLSHFRISKTGEIFVIAFFAVLPSATVVSRIEGRWLFISYLFVIIGIIVGFSTLSLKIFGLNNVRLIGLALGGFLIANIINGGDFKEYDLARILSHKIVVTAENESTSMNTWHLQIAASESQSVWINWALGNGGVVSNNLINPPRTVSFDSGCMTPCLTIDISEFSAKETISTFWTLTP